MIVTILDETGQDHWGQSFPPGLTPQQADEFVWGPWEFNAAATEQVISRRTSKARPYSRRTGKNWDRLDVRRTEPGAWMNNMSETAWRQERSGPLRLRLVCRREGYEEWTVFHDVEVTSARAGAQDR